MNNLKISDFEKSAKEKLGNEDFIRVQKEARLVINNLHTLQNEVASYVSNNMQNNDIGFNDLQRALDASPRKINQLIKGSGNFTIKTISEVASVFGKKAKIVFE